LSKKRYRGGSLTRLKVRFLCNGWELWSIGAIAIALAGNCSLNARTASTAPIVNLSNYEQEPPAFYQTAKGSTTQTGKSNSSAAAVMKCSSAANGKSRTVTLKWKASIAATKAHRDAVEKYRVCRSTQQEFQCKGNAEHTIAWVQVPSTTYVDKDVQPGRYFYVATAQSVSGIESDISNRVCVEIH